MSAATVLAPVFVQVALTFALLGWMGWHRIPLIRSGAIQTRDVALGQPNWPVEAIQAGNAFRNQFELPILFYLVSLLSLFTANSSTMLVVLGWLFVVTRLLHALVHVTTNNLPRRFIIFSVGAAILALMWIVFGFSLFFGGNGSLPPLDMDALGVSP